jgi:hypothetical protein
MGRAPSGVEGNNPVHSVDTGKVRAVLRGKKWPLGMTISRDGAGLNSAILFHLHHSPEAD